MAYLGYQGLMEAAREEIQEYTVSELQQRLQKGDDNYLLVDVRDIRELWQSGKIPDAYHAPRGMLEFWIDSQSPYHKAEFSQTQENPREFIFYCAAGWRSALAGKSANDCGLENVSHLAGGFSDWVEHGGEVVEVEKG